jgi:hypothetical protein
MSASKRLGRLRFFYRKLFQGEAKILGFSEAESLRGESLDCPGGPHHCLPLWASGPVCTERNIGN